MGDRIPSRPRGGDGSKYDDNRKDVAGDIAGKIDLGRDPR
jgi:hypothetical protein